MLRRSFLSLPLLLAACGRAPPAFRNTDITGAPFGGPLEMRDHNGRLRRLDDFRGRAVLLFFGYTTCPDVCPTSLAKFAEAVRALGERGSRVQVLFVTLDPERDTAERLKAYVPWFHPDFLGLYADRAGTDALAKAFGVYSAKQQTESGLGYVLDHTAGAYVFDPAGRLRLYLADGATVADIAADLGLLLDGR